MTGPLLGPSPNQFHHQYCVSWAAIVEPAIDLPTLSAWRPPWIARDGGDYFLDARSRQARARGASQSSPGSSVVARLKVLLDSLGERVLFS